MVLSALDEQGRIIPAKSAIKQRNYRCRECDGLMRLRSGQRRQPHFYHTSFNERCSACAKSERHMAVQQYLIKKLPFYESALEWRENEIGRIADVVWLHKSIVFEVQCSYISVEELQKRTEDWESAGYEVVWILHDTRYNKKRVNPVEQALYGRTFYYTNIDANGCGSIYDQYDLIDEDKRFVLIQRAIEKFALQETRTAPMPNIVNKRIEGLYPIFSEDVAGHCLNDDQFAKQLIRAEEKLLKMIHRRQRHRLLTRIWERIKEEYLGIYYHFLERACR